jgi:hypothetical protein
MEQPRRLSAKISKGVPRSSIIAPYFSKLYIQECLNIQENLPSHIHVYADDSVIIGSNQ